MKGTVRKEGRGKIGVGERLGNAAKPRTGLSSASEQNSAIGTTARSLRVESLGSRANLNSSAGHKSVFSAATGRKISVGIAKKSETCDARGVEGMGSDSGGTGSKLGRAVRNTEAPEQRDGSIAKSGSPARSTPKLERHFSFELEEGCLVLTEGCPVESVQASVAKEKPVKPLRKNPPKISSPGLKRRLPAQPIGEGINSIFSDSLKGTSVLGTAGKKPTKVVKIAEDGKSGSTTLDRKYGKAGSTGVKAGNVTTCRSNVYGKKSSISGGVSAKSGNVARESESKYTKVTEEKVKVLSLNECGDIDVVKLEFGNIALDAVKSTLFNERNECREGEDAGTEVVQDAGGDPVAASSPGDTSSAYACAGSGLSPAPQPWYPSRLTETLVQSPVRLQNGDIAPNLVANDSPVRLVSQDSGIDTRESFDISRNMFPDYFSSLTESAATTRGCITLVNDFGDVSEDIGLDKLTGMVTSREVELTPSCEPPGGSFCNYKFEGEFGDVSEDLGFGRFQSVPTEGSVLSEASAHSYGVYANPEEEEDVVRRRDDATAGFPGASADSGLFVMDDPYIYDEDYATCNEGEEDEFSLNDELMMEVLCANRVNQMTRTYDDVEAMRRLLEEKEKDLELTARIGKELLDRNQELKTQVQSLQAENRTAHDSNTQLRHELQQKTQILHALTSDEDGSQVDLASPLLSPSSGKSLPPILTGPLGIHEGKLSARESVARLRRKVDQLEQEKKSLQQEMTQLASETQLAEETEAILVEGVAQQLATVSDEKRLLSDELHRLRGEERKHREEMEVLIERLSEAHREIERLREENAMLSSKVQITTETQDKLAIELADFKEQYQEVSCLLSEAQENLRKVRQKSLPSALTGTHYLSLPITRQGYHNNHPGDSIASELEISMISEMSLDSGIHMPEAQGRIPHYRKVFETYRSASRTSNSPSPSPLHRTPSSFAQLSTTSTLSASSMHTCRVSSRPSSSSGGPTTTIPYKASSSFSNEVPKHLYGGMHSNFYTFDSAGQSEESDHSGVVTDNEDCLYPGTSNTRGRIRDGIPGSPGAKELQAALNRLDKERQPQLTKGDKAIGGYEGKSTGSSMDAGPHRWSSVGQALPYGCRTPDSIMSTGSSSRGSRSSWRMPERLMIMKIREGSQFLDEWSRLATPSLSAALEERPGVKVRGRMTDGVQQHTLMDFEEDDLISEDKSTPLHPGKFFQSTASVYTYTNSTVLHPDNAVPPSPQSPSSPTQQATPLLSRRSSVSTPTFSTALGLAKMLHERGAAPSDKERTKSHFTSATVTPCNSPDGSPLSSRSPSPEDDTNPIASLISSGAELLRRSLGGGPIRSGGSRRKNNRQAIGSLSRSDRKALAGMKLLEKLERIGLESLMQYSQPVRPHQELAPLSSAMLQVGSMYARPPLKSPMAQLTSLKSTLRWRSREEEAPSPAKRRLDLGTVPCKGRAESHRGTISAIFFGRKGGLM